jgi:hypothetical protein
MQDTNNRAEKKPNRLINEKSPTCLNTPTIQLTGIPGMLKRFAKLKRRINQFLSLSVIHLATGATSWQKNVLKITR